MEPEWLGPGAGLTFSNQFRTVGRKKKYTEERVCAGNEVTP